MKTPSNNRRRARPYGSIARTLVASGARSVLRLANTPSGRRRLFTGAKKAVKWVSSSKPSGQVKRKYTASLEPSGKLYKEPDDHKVSSCYMTLGSLKPVTKYLGNSMCIVDNSSGTLNSGYNVVNRTSLIHFDRDNELRRMAIVCMRQSKAGVQSALSGLTNEILSMYKDRIFLKRAYYKHSIINISQNPCFVKVYDMVCATNTTTSPHTIVNNEINALNDDSMSTTQEANAIEAREFTMNVPMNYMKVMKKNWKIKKVTKIWLDVGHTHEHKVSVVYNRLVDPSNIGNNFVDHTSTCCMVEVNGGLVKEQSNEKVAPGPTKIGIYSTKVIYFRRYDSSPRHVEGIESAATVGYTGNISMAFDDADEIKTFNIAGGLNTVTDDVQNMYAP